MTSAIQNAIREFQRGAAHYNRGEDIQAESAFTLAIQQDPKPAHFFLYRGLCRLRLNRIDEAFTDLTTALKRNPESPEAAWARARIFSDRLDYSAAARDFGRVIAIKPNDPLPYSARGEMYYHLRDWHRCLADYRKAVDLSPDDSKALNRLAWVLATCPVDELRSGKEALQLAQRANQLAGENDPLIWDTIAAAHAECGQIDQALEVMQRVQHKCPDHQLMKDHESAYRSNRPWRD